MKKMLRKILTVMVCVGIIFSTFVACGNSQKVETTETAETALEETIEGEGYMILTCDDDQLAFGLANGIPKDYKDLVIHTNYPIVVYQLVGRTGIIKNDYFEGDHKYNTFRFEKMEEKFYEIRLAAFDSAGNQVTSQTYYIQYLD